MFKKFIKLFIIMLVGSLILAGCSTDQEGSEAASEKFVIGISQLADHPALNAVREGFIEELNELEVEVDVDLQDAQGEIPNSVTISEKFVTDDVDLIFAIATQAAQSAKQTTGEIPIVFSAVTDPVDSELIETMDSPGGNITGTSDMAQMDKQLQLFKDIDPDVENIGIIFNSSEPNSHVQVDMAKDIAEDLGLNIVEVGIDTINNIPQAVDSIVSKVDGIYTITDNMVASSINVVANKAIENDLITVGAEDSHVEGGILISDGISYFDLGKQSARIAYKILVDGELPSDIPAEFAENTTRVLNYETLEVLGLDENLEVFQSAQGVE